MDLVGGGLAGREKGRGKEKSGREKVKGERKERKEKEKEKEKKRESSRKFFGFSKLDFILFSVFRNVISFSHISTRIFDI